MVSAKSTKQQQKPSESREDALIRAVANALIRAVANAEENGVAVQDLVELYNEAKGTVGQSEESINFIKGYMAALKNLGVVEVDSDRYSPVSPRARCFLGSLAVHVKEKIPMLHGWTDHGGSRDAVRIRRMLESIELRREEHNVQHLMPTRTVHAVVVIIKTVSNNDVFYLMKFNHRWQLGIWWFIGAITRESFADWRCDIFTEKLQNDAYQCLRSHLGLTKNMVTVEQLGDRIDGGSAISDRTGVYTKFFFYPFGAIINNRDFPKTIAHKYFSLKSGFRDFENQFSWLTKNEILSDLAPDERTIGLVESILERANQLCPILFNNHFVKYDVEVIENKYDTIICDAGGLLFVEPFWLDLQRQRFEKFERAVPAGLTEEHFIGLSRIVSDVLHSTDVRSSELMSEFYSAYNAIYINEQDPYEKGVLEGGGVIETLTALKRKNFKIYVLSGAAMSGEDFKRYFAKCFKDGDIDLIDGYFTTRDFGAGKTSSCVYNELLRRVHKDHEIDRVLFVSHDIKDILGARKSGKLDVVAANVHFSEKRLARKFATYYVNKFSDLIGLLKLQE
ncbi:MAG: HAD family hydrolase [Magnetococcales bacterium]|nr:HAD family hydrolase [Magnetococcales bacterium]